MKNSWAGKYEELINQMEEFYKKDYLKISYTEFERFINDR